MNVTIYVNPSAAIAAGSEIHGAQTVAVNLADIPSDLLPVLAAHADGRLDYSFGAEGGYPVLARADIEGVIRVLRHYEARREAERAKAAAEADKIAADVAAVQAAIARGSATLNHVGAYDGQLHIRIQDDDRYVTVPQAGFEAWVAEQLAIKRAKAEAAERAEDARRAAVEEQKAAGLARLREWALAHGSERLTLAIELDQPWDQIAREEFWALHTPAGYDRATYQDGTDEPRKNPSLADLRELRQIRVRCQQSDGVLVDPEIVYHTIEAETDEDGDVVVETRRYSAVHVTIISPDDQGHTVAKKTS